MIEEKNLDEMMKVFEFPDRMVVDIENIAEDQLELQKQQKNKQKLKAEKHKEADELDSNRGGKA